MRATRGIGSLMAAQSGSSGSGGDDDAPHFLPAATFAGAKAGYVFQRGAKGVGYYREGAGSTAAGGGGGDPGCSVGAGSSAAVAKRRNPFNDLFDDDDAEEELLNQQRLKPNKTSSLKLPPPPAASRRAPRMSDLDSFPDDDDDDDRVSTVTSSAWTADPGRKQGRLLDERFSKLLSAEYSDDEIGELDQDDPRVIGEEDLEVNARTPERPGRTVFLPASLPHPARARLAALVAWLPWKPWRGPQLPRLWRALPHRFGCQAAKLALPTRCRLGGCSSSCLRSRCAVAHASMHARRGD